jgi:hypothetical protein
MCDACHKIIVARASDNECVLMKHVKVPSKLHMKASIARWQNSLESTIVSDNKEESGMIQHPVLFTSVLF